MKVANSVAIAAPFIPNRGINKKFNINPINIHIPLQIQATSSLPVIIIIDPEDPNNELHKGESRMMKNVIFGNKKSFPK